MYINAISSEVEDLNESRFTIYCQPHFRAGRNPLCSLAAVGNPETMTECKTRASHDFVLPGEEEERVWSFNPLNPRVMCVLVQSLCTASLDPSLPPIAVKAVSTGSPPVRLDFDIAAGGENEPWKIKLLRPPSTDIYAV
ncbi:uncharacterized protein L969DRAFT_48554 [Mixia osmundae IAM 14324]|uniref:uncharacterized protein n=1 Tax=Mixia osmundae (strain CBS 9802 / IAM 14324 / JCM 22182 / KY 12970) TaxID=764103 RepID=UPI0004A54897|nr:uncharacterized protein L969DRAFT_48554 [Mixia osmundae IAM 14324]KEI39639.1 hypothetical protein L969DRAFT_48554 [Mixia osmundae IAM 14324]